MIAHLEGVAPTWPSSRDASSTEKRYACVRVLIKSSDMMAETVRPMTSRSGSCPRGFSCARATAQRARYAQRLPTSHLRSPAAARASKRPMRARDGFRTAKPRPCPPRAEKNLDGSARCACMLRDWHPDRRFRRRARAVQHATSASGEGPSRLLICPQREGLAHFNSARHSHRFGRAALSPWLEQGPWMGSAGKSGWLAAERMRGVAGFAAWPR